MGKQQSQDQGAHGLNPGTVVDGRYKIVRFIGQGGNGLVHEVEHVRTGRRLALKSLVDESGYGRLEQEARATCLMRNDHAVRITDMGRSESTGSYLVMELLEGQSLRALLEEAGQIPLELCVNIALQVCECLKEAHEQGIIHRDLKPENIFLCESAWPGQYDVRVLDFGVVKISSDGPIPNSSLTRTGSTVGTPYYMSLEQLRNPSNVDARADIYALGVVLYESLSGRKPFQAETIGDLVYALCSGPPTHLGRLRPDLPPEICETVMRALSMKREDRPATMTDFASVLLPHGNPAFGLWVRVNGKRPALLSTASPASSATPGGPPRPGGLRGTALMPPASGPVASPAPPSASLSPNIAPPAPPAPPAPTASLPAASPRPPGGVSLAGSVKRTGQMTMTEALVMPEPKPSSPEQKMMPDVEAPTRVRPERPNINLSGDRDTPTEMYVKGQHDAPSPLPSGSSGNRDTPTRGLPMPHGISSDALRSPFAKGEGDPDMPPRPQDEDDFGTMRMEPTEGPGTGRVRLPPRLEENAPPPQGSEMLGTMRLPTDGAVAEVRAALSAQGGMNPLPAAGQPADLRGTQRLAAPDQPGAPGQAMQPQQPQPMFGPPPTPSSQGYVNPMSIATMPPGTKRKAGWEQSLDTALVGVGRFFEQLAHKVRTASPKTQLVLAAAGASVVAAILVIVIYLMLG